MKFVDLAASSVIFAVTTQMQTVTNTASIGIFNTCSQVCLLTGKSCYKLRICTFMSLLGKVVHFQVSCSVSCAFQVYCEELTHLIQRHQAPSWSGATLHYHNLSSSCNWYVVIKWHIVNICWHVALGLNGLIILGLHIFLCMVTIYSECTI